MRAEVVGRIPAQNVCYLRVPYMKAHRILRLSDDVIPHGMKGARWLEITLDSPIVGGTLGYSAVVTVTGESSAEGSQEFSQGS